MADLNVKNGVMVTGRIAAAGLLALVNPLLAVIPFVETGTDEHANCRSLLETAKQAGNQATRLAARGKERAERRPRSTRREGEIGFDSR